MGVQSQRSFTKNNGIGILTLGLRFALDKRRIPQRLYSINRSRVPYNFAPKPQALSCLRGSFLGEGRYCLRVQCKREDRGDGQRKRY